MALRFHRPVYVVGGAVTPFLGKGHPDFVHPKHADFGKRVNPDIKEYIKRSVGDALEATKTPAEAVEQLWIGNFCGELFNQQGHLGSAFGAAHPALVGKPGIRTEGACASGGLAFYGAVQAILAGADITLAAGVEVQTTVSPRQGGDFLARASDYHRQRKLDDFTFPALFARRTKAYLEAFPNASHRDIAEVAAKAYRAGNKNPKAHMHHTELTADDVEKSICFLGNEELKPYLRVSECSQVSDGGAAVVIVSEEGLKKLGVPKSEAIQIRGLGVGCGDLWKDQELHRFETMEAVANRVYHATGWTPKDVEVAELHDCFAVAEILSSEAVGLAAPGEGAKLAISGASAPDGRIPINAGGGLVSFGHPVGATGVKQVFEIWSQITGCSPYGAKSVRRGITCNMGGEDKTVVFGAYEAAA
eukprot:TRINITY_DN12991_c0_g1_i1.p1 TRINITY_DN12991_c0_g1~~TRINITY_DN12991_c0_g1_i1.p1  ORF type:complete len:429 (+),score=117.58 TRINITY_DN12991_c0_g1_i1:35-1288(+)